VAVHTRKITDASFTVKSRVPDAPSSEPSNLRPSDSDTFSVGADPNAAACSKSLRLLAKRCYSLLIPSRSLRIRGS